MRKQLIMVRSLVAGTLAVALCCTATVVAVRGVEASQAPSAGGLRAAISSLPRAEQLALARSINQTIAQASPASPEVRNAYATITLRGKCVEDKQLVSRISVKPATEGDKPTDECLILLSPRHAADKAVDYGQTIIIRGGVLEK